MSHSVENNLPSRQGSAFSTTRWSIVSAAGSDDCGSALEQLLKAYWYPLYSFVRRSGHSIHDAQDITQGFLAHLLAHDIIGDADREKGRFRSYLLGALKNFMANSYRRATAQKRGGGASIFDIDDERYEKRFNIEYSNSFTPADQFEHSWAMSVLARVTEALRSEFEAAGRSPLFEALHPRLAGNNGGQTYADIAAEMGMSESSISVSVHRMRKRYGELLRLEIAETVTTPEDVEPELQHLINVVSAGTK